MSSLVRYVLLQLPGTALVAILLWWSVSTGFLQAGMAALLLAGWVLKDALLYPAFRHSIRPAATGAEALIGREAILVRAADPVGQIRLDGEVWKARCRHGRHIAAGRSVRVIGAKGLMLIVEPAESDGLA